MSASLPSSGQPMDIYFCDECSARITDLDLRAGKGMRRLHDNICGDCVDRGLAKQWLGSAGVGGAKANGAQQSNARTPLPAPAAVAIAEPDPISIARDRARTVPDDPFSVEEPVLVKPAKAVDTEALAKPRPQVTTAEAQPIDSLSYAAGGFGALVGSAESSAPKGLVDDPADFEVVGPTDSRSDDHEQAKAAPAESPFDFVHPQDNENPGKAETSEIDAIRPTKADKPEKSASGRQSSLKRGSTSTSSTGRRNIKPASTRRAHRQGGNKKVMILSLVSCVVMVVIFFGFVYPNVNKPRKPAEVIRDEPLVNLKETINAAKAAASAGLQSDDLATVKKGIDAIRTMQTAFLEFQRKAGSQWNEDAHGQQLYTMGYYDVQGMLKQLNDRKGIIEKRL